MNTTYYTENHNKLLAQFRKKEDSLKYVLASEFPAEAEYILSEMHGEFLELLPRLPYIGGDKNLLTENLVVSAWFLSLYKVLNKRGHSDEFIGDLCYRIAEHFVQKQPQWAAKLQGILAQTKLFKMMYRKISEKSQKREYPGDFVAQFVEGVEGKYDYGFDFTECGICKLFKTENAEQFTKHMCRIDYLTTSFNGVELIRTGTIANGAEKCDFRFRKLKAN
jgi:hypothetical protein